MLKIFFLFIVSVHGLIHLMGFVKGFGLAEMSQLTQPISKVAGIVWLATTLLFALTLVLFLVQFDYWWVAGGLAIVISQVLVILNWGDAKFGTVANIIILVPVFLATLNSLPGSFQNTYKSEVEKRLAPATSSEIITEQDLAPLPEPVQKYLRYVGVVGKPKVHNFRVLSSGSMKQNADSNWIEIKAQQYDFFDSNLARLFYIKSDLFGVPFDGLHSYTDNATMQIKIASLLQVADAKGPKMNQSENVTIFNDMCLLAPATLINKDIRWEAVDELTARAKFTNNGITVGATLYFNLKGEMVDFSSDDRFLSADGKTYNSYRWSTPVRDYRDYNGVKLASYGDAIWHQPAGDYTYARYNLDQVSYNNQAFAFAS